MDRLLPPMRGFTAGEVDEAAVEWGCNCGPASIAAVLGMTLNAVRPHMGDFESKRYTNPSLMWAALRSLSVKFSYRAGDLGRDNWPSYGLARIQWEGPRTKPGVPPRVAYRQTHWVGVNAINRQNIGIFDVNAVANDTGWVSAQDWVSDIVPWILKHGVPRADGGWHITHAVEIANG